MTSGKNSFWLAGAKPPAPDVSSTIPGRFVGDGEAGTVRVEVGEPGNIVNVPSGGGVFSEGAPVVVQLAPSGAPMGLLSSTTVASDASKRVYVGEEGAVARQALTSASDALAEAEKATRKMEAALKALEEANKEVPSRLAQLERDLQEASKQVLAARNMYTVASRAPTSADTQDRPAGAVWEQVGPDGKATGRWVFQSGEWKAVSLDDDLIGFDRETWTRLLRVAGDATIGGNLLAGGSVTAEKVVASKELSAKVAQFEDAVVDKLRAQRAVITGDLIAERLVGKELVGGSVTASGDGGLSTVAIDSRGLVPEVRFNRRKSDGSNIILTRLVPTGVDVVTPSDGVFSYSWRDLIGAPSYRFASGKVNYLLPVGRKDKLALRTDSTSRAKQMRTVGLGGSLMVPRSGRYKVTCFACVQTSSWSNVISLALLRGDAEDAEWGDLYSYAYGPENQYVTPSVTGTIDVSSSEKISLGLSASENGAYLKDYRVEVDYVCPL